MPRVSVEQFAERLEKGKHIPAVLLLGDEIFLRDSCRSRVVETLVVEAARTWGVSRFSAKSGETQAALDQARTMPMLSPKQVVFLADAEAIEKFGEKNRDETVQLIEDYLANPAPFTVLVIEACALDQRMRLAKLLSERTLVVDVALAEDADARIAAGVGLARSLAKEQGIQFASGAAEDLAEFVSGDLLRLKTEIEKLATYAGDRKTIRREDVAALVISEKTSTIWEVAELLASRQSKRALEFFDRLVREGEEPLQMLGALAWMYRKLVEASEIRGAANGWQAARALGMRPEQAELALRSARKISKPQLLAGLRALQQADDRLKGGTDDPRAVMEFLLAQLTTSRA